VNSSIGSQWKNQIEGLQDKVSEALDVPGLISDPDLVRFINMNVRLLPG